MSRLTVGVVQHACGERRGDNLAASEKCIREAAAGGAEVVLLPELHTLRYFCQTEDVKAFDLAEPVPGPTTRALCELARALGVVIAGSVFERRAPGLHHDTAVVLDRSGDIAGLYRKMHVPDDPGFQEKFYFAPGDRGFTPIDTTAGRLGVLACWDQWYPEAARLMALAGARVLLFPSAIGWSPGDDAAERQRQREAWITMQRAHAIANSLHVVAANRTGLQLRAWLKGAYLPIALVVLTLLIVADGRLAQWIIINTDFGTNLPPPLEAGIEPLINNAAFPMLFTLSNASSLFVPLVFIRWQYNFRSVLLFILLTTVLELGLLLRIREINSPEYSLEVFAIFTRNGAFFIVGYIVSQLTALQRRQHEELQKAHRQALLYVTTHEKLLVSHERNRLARELHDTLAHTMSAVTVKLNATHVIWERDSERAKTMLGEVINSLNEGNVEIRRALRDLRATPLDDMGLVLAVRNLAEAAQEADDTHSS